MLLGHFVQKLKETLLGIAWYHDTICRSTESRVPITVLVYFRYIVTIGQCRVPPGQRTDQGRDVWQP